MNSVLSHPMRGPGGDPHYRGNCGANFLREVLGHYRPAFVVDPMSGSGTTGDVCQELRIRYQGFDLRDGFNLLKDRLADRLADSPDYIFTHPPYHDMVKYSGPGGMWGCERGAHPDDLSNCKTPEDFLEKLQLALMNAYEPLAPEGHLAVLIGDQRKNGTFCSYQADVIRMGIGRLCDVIVKAQHNTLSERVAYTGKDFVHIQHEYLLVFVKDRRILSIGEVALAQTRRLSREFFGTWRNAVTVILRELGGRAALADIYRRIGERVEPGGNLHVQEKVRQVLQQHFVRVESGVYALP